MAWILPRKLEKKRYISKVEVSGHAKYDEYGKDIVCASVSSIVTTTVNAIVRVCEDSISYDESDGKVLIKVLKDDDNTNKLLENMIDLLGELSQTYPKNITIK